MRSPTAALSLLPLPPRHPQVSSAHRQRPEGGGSGGERTDDHISPPLSRALILALLLFAGLCLCCCHPLLSARASQRNARARTRWKGTPGPFSSPRIVEASRLIAFPRHSSPPPAAAASVRHSSDSILHRAQFSPTRPTRKRTRRQGHTSMPTGSSMRCRKRGPHEPSLSSVPHRPTDPLRL